MSVSSQIHTDDSCYGLLPLMLKPGILGEPGNGSLTSQQTQRPVRRSRWPLLAFLAFSSGYLLLENSEWNFAIPQIFPTRRCGQGSRRTQVPSGTNNPAYLVRAAHGAVASENVLCSEIGVNTMKAGGNAVDAIVSTTLCIGVANMFS